MTISTSRITRVKTTSNKKKSGAMISSIRTPYNALVMNAVAMSASAPNAASTTVITNSTLTMFGVMSLVNERSKSELKKLAASWAFTGGTYRAGAGAAAAAGAPAPVAAPQAVHAAAPGVNWLPHCAQKAINLFSFFSGSLERRAFFVAVQLSPSFGRREGQLLLNHNI